MNRLLALVAIALLGALTAQGQELCESATYPHLVITTDLGQIEVELHEDAAPQAVRRLARLAEGPTFHPELTAEREDSARVGYFDGLRFGHAQPHVEIISDARTPGTAITIETEIDAVSLGLDTQRIENPGRAMDIAQMELAPAFKRDLAKGRTSDLLNQWMDRLYSTHDASFLVGTSRQEINEALGYRYQEGLASRQVTRGAVMLAPLTPQQASPRLAIALTDLPRRTGRWMVVGQVVKGLNIAQEISIRPLADPAIARSKYRPVEPVGLQKVRLACRPNS